jgi:hypothetical protein
MLLAKKLFASVSNSVLSFQYRGRARRYNTGIPKNSIPVLAGIEVFSRNIPLPLKQIGTFDVCEYWSGCHILILYTMMEDYYLYLVPGTPCLEQVPLDLSNTKLDKALWLEAGQLPYMATGGGGGGTV